MVLLGTGRVFFHWADFLRLQNHYTKKKNILVTIIHDASLVLVGEVLP